MIIMGVLRRRFEDGVPRMWRVPATLASVWRQGDAPWRGMPLRGRHPKRRMQDSSLAREGMAQQTIHAACWMDQRNRPGHIGDCVWVQPVMWAQTFMPAASGTRWRIDSRR